MKIPYNLRVKIIKSMAIYPPFSSYLSSSIIGHRHHADGCVLMLHRVANRDVRRLAPNENLKVSPAYMERLILNYKKRDIRFFSLDDVADYIVSGYKSEAPFVCFTLDDGYKDNFDIAYPIFKKYQVPFAIFVTTDFPDYKARLWWYEIEDLILSKSELRLGNGEVIQCSTYKEKCDAFLYVRSLILKLDRLNFEKEYINLLNISESHAREYAKTLSMSWDDISSLASDSLCTIGGHSMTHPPFNMLSEKELEFEVTEGCGKLERAIGKRIEHFAYPFGTSLEIGEREHSFMSRFQFKTILTASHGYINHETDVSRIPRVFLSESI